MPAGAAPSVAIAHRLGRRSLTRLGSSSLASAGRPVLRARLRLVGVSVKAIRSPGWQSRISQSAISTCRFSRSGLPVTSRQTCVSDSRDPALGQQRDQRRCGLEDPVLGEQHPQPPLVVELAHQPSSLRESQRAVELGAQRGAHRVVLVVAADRRCRARSSRRMAVPNLHLHEQSVEAVLDQMRDVAVAQAVRRQLARQAERVAQLGKALADLSRTRSAPPRSVSHNAGCSSRP